jgi:hypothetical protein
MTWRPARHRTISENIDALPDALLILAKGHMRVDHSAEDEQVRYAVQRAISRFQTVNESCLNPTVVEWKPDAEDFVDGIANVPVRPAKSFTATADPAATDVAANYVIVNKWESIHGVEPQVLVGAYAAGLTLTLTCGAQMPPPPDTEAARLPPDVVDIIFRHAAHLFNHREILLPGREYVAPDLKMDASWWMPRV